MQVIPMATVTKDFKIGDVTPKGAETISVQKKEITATDIGKVNFMTTLNYKAENPTQPVGHAHM